MYECKVRRINMNDKIVYTVHCSIYTPHQVSSGHMICMLLGDKDEPDAELFSRV